MVERVEQFFENEWTDFVWLWIFRAASELLPSKELRIKLFGWIGCSCWTPNGKEQTGDLIYWEGYLIRKKYRERCPIFHPEL
jgi:hypothetical protein